MGFRITTWNVNGIRNPFSYQPWRDKRTFDAMFDTLEADIAVLQETKIQRKDLRDDMVLVKGWDCYFSLPKHEKGKFGVVIYTRQSTCAPIRAEEGLTGVLCPPNSSTSFCDLPEDQQIGGYPTPVQALKAPHAPDNATDFTTLDSEGRCVILEFPAFVLLGVYNPAVRDESRNAFRIAFLNLLDIRIRNLVAMGKRVILAGDLNVSKCELDMANAEAEIRKQETTPVEFFSTPSSRFFNHLLEDGQVYGERDEGREEPVLFDVCRSFHPTRKGMFTHWETKINARPGNYGSRIDYVLCSRDMKDWFDESNIQEGLMGSDHCPVYAVFKERISINGQETHILDAMNPEHVFLDGARLREYSAKDLLPTSGKLIPEFSGRRNIRDMFSKKPSVSSTPHKSATVEEVSSGPGALDSELDVLASPKPEVKPAVLASSKAEKVAPKPATSPATGSKRALPDKPAARSLKRSKSGNVGGNATSVSSDKGQQSLKGFFKPKANTSQSQSQNIPKHSETPSRTPPQVPDAHNTTNEASTSDGKGNVDFGEASKNNNTSLPSQASATDATLLNTSFNTSAPSSSAAPPHSLDGAYSPPPSPNAPLTPANPHATVKPAPAPDPGLAGGDPVAAHEQRRDAWSQLFSKPAAPRCEGHAEPCKTMLTRKPGANCGRAFWMCARPLGPSGAKERGTQWRCPTFVWCSDWSSGGGGSGGGGGGGGGGGAGGGGAGAVGRERAAGVAESRR